MLNPVEWYIKFFWPTKEITSKELVVRYRVLLYFNFFSALICLYSIVKWTKLDHSSLVYSSAFGLAAIIANSFYVKTAPPPVISANIILLGTFPHGVNMIYSLGGDALGAHFLDAYACLHCLPAH